MGILTRITGRAADALVKRSPAYQEATARLQEATELLSVYTVLDPRFWQSAGASQRDMTADVRNTISRQAWTIVQTHPTAANFVNTLSAFIVGPGFQVKHPDPAADEVVQEYIADDGFMTKATKAVNQYLITAEVPTLIFINTLTGAVKIRLFDPLELYDVAYDADDNEVIVALWRRYTRREASLSAGSWTWITTEVDDIIKHDDKRPDEWGAYTVRDFLFWARPTIPAATRGVSFMTPALTWLTQYEKMLEARLALNRARATYARDLDLGEKATQEQCEALQTKLNATGEPKPGSWFVHNTATKLGFPAPNIGAGDAKDDLRATILMAVAGLGIPEFIGTGDAANGNYASTTNVAQAFVKSIQKREFELSDGFIIPAFGFVLDAAANARRISPAAASTPVEVTYPQIMADDLTALAQVVTAGLAQGFLDPETVVDLLPWNIKWDTVKERLDKQREEKISYAGGIPDVHPPEEPQEEQP